MSIPFEPPLRSALDPLHGLIRLTDSEMAVIDHLLFQRLRRIKQNGLLYYVFPSATHHRLEHSLGALHVATLMLEALWVNSAVARKKGSACEYESVRTDVAIDIRGASQERLQWFVGMTRMAALVHDLGHGPLSHTFDSFAPFRKDLQSLLTSNAIPTLNHSSARLANWGKKKGSMEGSTNFDRVPHEVMSCVLFAIIWDDLLKKNLDLPSDALLAGVNAELVPLCVAAVILGEPSLVTGMLEAEALEWIPLMHDIVASAPADADRMDYLERDSRAIGVTYGFFDRNRILKSLLIFRRKTNRGQEYRLGVKRSGIPAFENLVQARYEMYVQIYYHKTNKATGLMLSELANEAQKAKVRLFQVDSDDPGNSIAAIVQTYLDLSDDAFLSLLRGAGESSDEIPPSVKRLAADVFTRTLWKRIYEGDEKVTSALADLLRNEFSEVAEDIVTDSAKPGATKDLDKGAFVLGRAEDGIYCPQNEHDWFSGSDIISALRAAEKSIGRIYAKGAAIHKLPGLKQRAREIGRALEVQVAAVRKREATLRALVTAEIEERLRSKEVPPTTSDYGNNRD